MTKTQYGVIAGIAGAAVATWWWRRRDYVAEGMSEAGRAHDRGELIFSNTPNVAQ